MFDEAYVKEERGRRLSVQPMLKVLRKYKKKGKLLDIGCSTGFLLDEARKQGWQAYGIELSKWAVEYAKDKLGLENIIQGELRDAGHADSFFDVVIMKDTIEHLADVKGTLIEIRRILKPDGLLYINTPNIDSSVSKILRARWWGIKQSHLYYFTRRTLNEMLISTGFKPVKTSSYARTFSLEYWIRQLKGYDKTIHKLFMFLVRRNIFKNNLLRINLGDQIEVYAKKIRKLEYLEELEKSPHVVKKENMKVVVVLPAFNAAKTLKKTVDDIPEGIVDDIICVDDASQDNTAKVAKALGVKVFVHKKNKGYGANQKTC